MLQVMHYSRSKPPYILNYPADSKSVHNVSPMILGMRGWEMPNLYVMYTALKVHRALKKHCPQYRNIDGIDNIWISKPSYNARGVGIFCFDEYKDAFVGGAVNKSLCPKVVQKYIERPFLLKKRKFDLR